MENRQQKMMSHFFREYERNTDTYRVINHLLNMTDDEFIKWRDYLNEKAKRLQIENDILKKSA